MPVEGFGDVSLLDLRQIIPCQYAGFEVSSLGELLGVVLLGVSLGCSGRGTLAGS
jgi:hypothetical protein